MILNAVPSVDSSVSTVGAAPFMSAGCSSMSGAIDTKVTTSPCTVSTTGAWFSMLKVTFLLRWMPALSPGLMVIWQSAVAPGAIGSFGHTGVVQPQPGIALVMRIG